MCLTHVGVCVTLILPLSLHIYTAANAAVLLCRYAGTLEAMYVEHEERQKERIRAIREGGGAGSVAERVRQV